MRGRSAVLMIAMLGGCVRGTSIEGEINVPSGGKPNGAIRFKITVMNTDDSRLLHGCRIQDDTSYVLVKAGTSIEALSDAVNAKYSNSGANVFVYQSTGNFGATSGPGAGTEKDPVAFGKLYSCPEE